MRELKKRNRLLESMYVGLDRRLYRCLLDLAEIDGPDEARPVIPFTQEQLADLVGGTRPSVNQVLQRLLAQGVIEVGRGQVVMRTTATSTSITSIIDECRGPRPRR